MESKKELPTAEEYLLIYLNNQNPLLFPKFDRWIDFMFQFPKELVHVHYVSAMEEYAVLFAKWHVSEALKAASGKFDAYYNKHAIENAYPEALIK